MDIEWRHGWVLATEPWSPGCTLCQVEVGRRVETALAYHDMVGQPGPGAMVWLNTTAVALGLGTGGHHLVAWIEGGGGKRLNGPGHLIKLRYTPLQGRVLAAEEPESPYRGAFETHCDLEGRPVLALSLHSQLGPVCLAAQVISRGSARVAFVMTDGAALPLPLSRLAARLKEGGWLDRTITSGHAFGGDLETISLYSAIQAAAYVCGADLIAVGPGPGTAGTGTPLGHTGLDLGETINAIASLGGLPVAIPRISFRDRRPRHYGVSHHTLTALGRIALAPAAVPVPDFESWQRDFLLDQFWRARVIERHRLYLVGPGLPLDPVVQGLKKINWTTMGRGPAEELEAVSACLAATALVLGWRHSQPGHTTCPGGI